MGEGGVFLDIYQTNLLSRWKIITRAYYLVHLVNLVSVLVVILSDSICNSKIARIFITGRCSNVNKIILFYGTLCRSKIKLRIAF